MNGFGGSCAGCVALEKHQFGVHLEGKDGTRMPATGRSITKRADNGRYVGFGGNVVRTPLSETVTEVRGI